MQPPDRETRIENKSPTPANGPKPLHVRLAWFAAIWAASVAALTVVAMLIRLVL